MSGEILRYQKGCHYLWICLPPVLVSPSESPDITWFACVPFKVDVVDLDSKFKVHPWSRAVASVTGGHAGRTAAWHSVNSFMVRLVICHGTYRKRHPASLTYAKALRKHLAIMQERADQCCLQWHLNPPTKEPSSLRNLKCQLVWHCWSMTSTFSSCIQNLEKSSLRMTKKKSGWWVDWEIQPWNMGLRWLGLQGHFIHLDPLLVSLEKVAKMYG